MFGLPLANPAELLTALRRFGLENDRLDAAVARRLDAGTVEFKAMDHLHAVDELTPGQLGDRLALTSGAVTALIDRLEQHGWVERVPHATDRRSVMVRRAKGSETPRLYAAFGEEHARSGGGALGRRVRRLPRLPRAGLGGGHRGRRRGQRIDRYRSSSHWVTCTR